MIPMARTMKGFTASKPRASGDDPYVPVNLDTQV